MTLRVRLALGMFAIAVVLLVPLLLTLHALRTAESSARQILSEEFAASLLVGRLRGTLEDVRAAENAVLFVRNDAAHERMRAVLGRTRALSDSLAQFNLAEAGAVRSGVDSLAAAADAEFAAARGGSAAAAEQISQTRFLPTLERMESVIGRAERALATRSAHRVNQAVSATHGALGVSGGALALAALLAALIGLWLMRSISGPVKEFERGMSSVAEGDFSYKLNLDSTRRDEFGRLAGSYDAMTHQLAELDRLKAEFMSVASHELKTPINVILGYLELLREGIYGRLDDKQLEVLATVEKQTRTLTRLVRQLLDVSRFEAGGGRVEPREIDLTRFIDHLETTFHVLAAQRGIDFRIHRAPGLPKQVAWDEDRMNEVIGNLLSNAFKFTERDGRVTLAMDTVDSMIRIQVRDTGAGIPAEQLPHVFQKFYQADNQEQSATAGTGLGLAIAKQIVDAHGGTITVDSIENVGTTFVITLPQRVVSLKTTAKHRSSDTGLR